MKILYIDTETTGLYPNIHGIHQLAGIVEIDGEVKEEFEFFIKPFSQDKIDPAALAISKTKESDILNYKSPDLVYQELVKILSKYINKFNKQDKFFISAYNAKFDADFLRAFFRKNNDNYFNSWFWSGLIDIISIAAFYIANNNLTKEIESFKLESMMQYFGIEFDQGSFHNALYDIRNSRELYTHIKNRILNNK